MKISLLAFAGLAGLALAPTAGASVIDFEGLGNGAVVTNQYAAAPDYVTFSIDNPNRSFDIGAVFDTNVASSNDPDLNGPAWSGGNIVNENLGNILIISQVNDTDGNGFVNGAGNDEGSRPAGSITLAYSRAFTVWQCDIVDIENATLEHSSFEFYEGGLAGTKALVDFGDLIDSNSAFYDPTIAFGDRSANRIRPITAADLGLGSIDTVVIRVGGSSGYDNFNASGFVPAPGSVALLAFGAMGLIRRRRA